MANTELKKGVSVIICSFNGAKKLPNTLQHLINQRINNNINWEIIFVDNNSNDDTLEVVKNYWRQQKSDIPIRIITETKAGKYYALTRGVNEAKYNYFIVCDDDNWLSDDYIERAFHTLEQNPSIGALGGKSIAEFESNNTETPKWFTDDQERYAIGKQGIKSGLITHRKFIWGAGMVSHVSLYKEFYSHYPSLLLKNEGHFIAEDTEYCLRLILRGYHLFYDDDLSIKHFVPMERLSKEYNTILNRKIEESFEIIDIYLFATKIYGSLANSKLDFYRLKLLTAIRLITSKQKNRRKHKILSQLTSNKVIDNNIKEIKKFSTDPRLPSFLNKK